MNYAEPQAAHRYIPIYITSGSTGVTGLAPLGSSNLQVSKSGSAFTNATGGWVEVGSGMYWYIATQLETTTESFLTVKVLGGDFPFVISEPIGNWMTSGETNAAYRRVPLYLIDTSGAPVIGLTLTGSIEVNAGSLTSWSAATGTWGETGSGCYYYVAASADIASNPGQLGVKVITGSTKPFIVSVDIIDVSTIAAIDCGSYLGDYLGGCDTVAASTSSATPRALAAPYTPSSPQYVDHTAQALARLCEQFRSD